MMLSLPKNFLMLPVELELNLNLLVRPESLHDLSPTTLSKLPSHSSLFPASASVAFSFLFFKHTQLVPQQSFCATIFLWLELSSPCHQDFDFFDYDFFSKSNIAIRVYYFALFYFYCSNYHWYFTYLFFRAHVSPLDHKLFESRHSVLSTITSLGPQKNI